MRLAVVAVIAVAFEPAHADETRELGLEIGPAYHRAVDIGYYGTEMAATLGREHYGFRVALGLGVAPTRMDYNNSGSGRLDRAAISSGAYLQLRPHARVRAIAGASIGLDFEEWPSTDGNYVDSALLLALGAHAGVAVDLVRLDSGRVVWLGPFAELDWRPIELGNHIQGQATALSLTAVLGVRL